VLKVQVDTNKFSVVPIVLGIIVPLPAKIRLSSSMMHSEQLWDTSSYLRNEYCGSFRKAKQWITTATIHLHFYAYECVELHIYWFHTFMTWCQTSGT